MYRHFKNDTLKKSFPEKGEKLLFNLTENN